MNDLFAVFMLVFSLACIFRFYVLRRKRKKVAELLGSHGYDVYLGMGEHLILKGGSKGEIFYADCPMTVTLYVGDVPALAIGFDVKGNTFYFLHVRELNSSVTVIPAVVNREVEKMAKLLGCKRLTIRHANANPYYKAWLDERPDMKSSHILFSYFFTYPQTHGYMRVGDGWHVLL